MKKNSTVLLKRVYPYFYKYRGILMIDLLCAGLTTVSEMALPVILRFLTRISYSELTMNIIVKISLLFIVLKVIDIMANYFMTSLGHIMGANIETDMRSDIYAHLQTLPDSYYNDTKIGQIMSRMTNDLFDITEFAHHCPEEYFIGAVKIVVATLVLSSINLPLTVMIIVLIPIMIVLSSKYNRRMRATQKSQRQHIGDLNSNIEDSLLGIRVVKSFANEQLEKEKFEKDNNLFLQLKKQFYYSMAGFSTVNRTFDGLMYLVVIFGGGYFLYTGAIVSSDLVAFVLYVQTLLTTVRRIVEFTEQFQKGITGIERFCEIMDTQSTIVDCDNAVDLQHVQGKIVFNNVSFSYEKDGEKVLDKVSLTIEPGKNIALVGPSGAGKTTICNLIPRFYDVSEGSIEIDGHDVRNLSLKSLRDQIGMVHQDVYLFSGTIEDNIRYGKPKASNEEIIEAAKMAGAYDFIMDLEHGFQSNIGERGVKLSGGQKQRLSIARVFLKNPPIILLDEATSALDNQSEKIVQESLEKLMKGRTTITIAHRLTTIENADEINVIAEGGIIEKGSHQQLVEKKGYYYHLYHRH